MNRRGALVFAGGIATGLLASLIGAAFYEHSARDGQVVVTYNVPPLMMDGISPFDANNPGRNDLPQPFLVHLAEQCRIHDYEVRAPSMTSAGERSLWASFSLIVARQTITPAQEVCLLKLRQAPYLNTLEID